MLDNAPIAEPGKSITIRYDIILEDGTKVAGRTAKPFTFKMGARRVFPALEAGVAGMKLNEIRKIPIAAAEGYGMYNDKLVLKVDRKNFSEDLKLAPGRTVQYQDRDGVRANFVVREVDEQSVILDGNHPLAGHDLIYEVELLAVQ
jgi:peptidylprolyl isomerase